MIPQTDEQTFPELYRWLCYQLIHRGYRVDTGHWQALENVPQTETQELLNVNFRYPIPETAAQLRAEVEPNMPWAEDQFQERVGGEPLNPGETFKDWPYYRGNVEQHKEQGQFSHTYMERFWPRYADYPPEVHGTWEGTRGIRYRYGDLDDVLMLLRRQPTTRQAYLPIFFPEDTGAHHGERIPCTLGYHLIRRNGQLHIVYFIRSCDLFRHFRDDVYMAARLVQWVIHHLQAPLDDEVTGWESVVPGTLTMHITSLHIFAPEVELLQKRLAREAA